MHMFLPKNIGIILYTMGYNVAQKIGIILYTIVFVCECNKSLCIIPK
jgi:hypothetical protein